MLLHKVTSVSCALYFLVWIYSRVISYTKHIEQVFIEELPYPKIKKQAKISAFLGLAFQYKSGVQGREVDCNYELEHGQHVEVI